MRKLLLTLLTLTMLTASFAQGWRQGEMEVKVTINSTQDAQKLASLKLNGDIYSAYATMYVTPDELRKIEATGLDYSIQIDDLNGHFADFWEKDDAYHSYQEIINLADSLAENFPSICKKVVYGTSLGGRQLAALKISDNVMTDENEPELFFDGGIHGDEIGGPENLIRFARDLCLGYGSNTQITNLVNGRETWLYLMVNPDGRVNMTRYNNNGEDLNRDCGYMWDQESVGSWSQQETRILRNAIMETPFVVYTSYHSGTEFISHPWSYRASQSPDHAHVNQLASVYADVSGYSNIPYGPGYTGMYPINGSTKDAGYGIQGSVSWSMEISMSKQPPASQIMLYYNYNKPAMLAMMEYSGYGLAGTVTDETTGEPVAATVFVNNYFPCYTDVEVGDYHKYVLPGTYNITVKANGYQTKVVTGVVVTANNATVTNFQLTQDDNQGIYKIIASQIPGNNPNDEGATWACIGQPDNVNYSIGKSGWIIVDMKDIIFDGAGPDLMVFEGDASAEGYTFYAGTSMDGPWYTMGTGSGSTEFSFENCTLSEARYFKILDDGDGNASAADAGFDLDAIQALSAVTGPYLLLESVEVDDSNGNNNGILEPGETADYIITLKNAGSETALAIVGTLTCNDPYVTVVTTQPQTFGNININASATATYTVSAQAGAPAGHVATLQLDYQGTNVALTTKLIDVTFPDYCSASTGTEDEYIANVSFGTINNSSGWQGGVGNYTNLSTILEPGVAVPITITNGNAWASDIVYVWVDWNNDFELGSPSNETFQLTNVGGQGQTFTGNITAPAGTNPGHYRLRARMTYSSAPTPCGSATYGEVEDYTVVIEGDILQAGFTSDVNQICHGGQVHFYDNSVGNITSWEWEFPGGTPATSNEENPLVTYANAGMYGVTLTVSDGTNSNTAMELEYLIVYPDPEQPAIPTGPTELCQNAANSTYTTNNAVGATGWTWEILPVSAGALTPNGPSVIVDWSATYSGTATLKVKTSNLCGESNWSGALEIVVVPVPLAPANITGAESVCWGETQLYQIPAIPDATEYLWYLDPNSSGVVTANWNECTITWSDSYIGNATLKVKAANDCGEGPFSPTLNIMVDDCLGVDEPAEESAIKVFPNPSTGVFTISFDDAAVCISKVTITATTGVIVFNQIFEQSGVESPLKIELSAIPDGIYFLKLEGENQLITEKIVVRR